MAASCPADNKLLECAVCFNIYKNPLHLVKCGHSFCAQCITELTENGKIFVTSEKCSSSTKS